MIRTATHVKLLLSVFCAVRMFYEIWSLLPEASVLKPALLLKKVWKGTWITSPGNTDELFHLAHAVLGGFAGL